MSIDWNLRDYARAKMRITVRRLLKKYVLSTRLAEVGGGYGDEAGRMEV